MQFSICLLVNVEFDSMGGVFEVGGTIRNIDSPRRAAIENIQAEIRQEYNVREERRRELEFLEKGGNPLNFRFDNVASVSVQSTSLADQNPQLEAKSSFAFTASPHGDSVESSGRPGAPSVCEPNIADNLMLFSGENDSIDGDKILSAYPSRIHAAQTEHSFQLDGSQNAKERRDTAAFSITRKAYRRRDRSRPSRDGDRSSSSSLLLSHGGNGNSVTCFNGSRDFNGLASDLDKRQDKISSDGNLVSTCADMTASSKTVASKSQVDAEVDIIKAIKSTKDPIQGHTPESVRDPDAMELNDDQRLDSGPDAHRSPIDQSFGHGESFRTQEFVVSEGLESQPSLKISLVENEGSFGHTKGFSFADEDASFKKSTPGAIILESESSGAQSILGLDTNNGIETCPNERKGDTSGNIGPTCILDGNRSIQGDQVVEGNKEFRADGNITYPSDEGNFLQQSDKEDKVLLKALEGSNGSIPDLEKEKETQNQDQVQDQNIIDRVDVNGCYGSELERKTNIPLVDDMNPNVGDICAVGPQSTASNVARLPDAAPPAGVSDIACDTEMSPMANLVPSKADEDSLLEEARIIEAKHKMIAEFSASSLPMCYGRKSHWHFVLEEMAWLANDFAQERLWKITASSQVCRQVSSVSLKRLRCHEQKSSWESKKAAYFLATAVMEFWHSLEKTSHEQELKCRNKDCSQELRDYALRFQKYNCVECLQAEAPATPISDLKISDMSFNGNSTEENIFYQALPGALEKCRKSIEFHVKYERTGSSLKEEVETSARNAVADFGSHENLLEEDGGETSMYYMSVAFNSCMSSALFQKKRKKSSEANGLRPVEVVADSQLTQCIEKKAGSHQPFFLGKCPTSSLNVSFPTKRMRTSNRQRFLSPFSAGTSSCVLVPAKTDASSGDTSSFQDDLSTLHDESHVLSNLEVESAGNFEKQLLYDPAEVSTKSKKKKKAKPPGSAYEQRWQVDCNFQSDQGDLSKKRRDIHHFESNSTSGLFGQHIVKKQKTIRHSIDNSFESSAQHCGSAPSPVASQISSPSKLGKYFGGRDRGRKSKMLKGPCRPSSGSGSAWSLFEEQALVVLVHDLGPNWDLISDAINSALQFKCIFRNPKECKERHKQLMDRSAGDGGDSAEDSGSSQPYSSTLPGIPKGSARQLFQRLQGPMEEDTVKSHFEKMIMIGQKLHCRRKQEPKQIQPPHGSHMISLTQVSPNNLSGGPILTPLDLCEAIASSPDSLPLGYQGPHSGGLPFYNQGTNTSMLAASTANSPVSGSSNMTPSNSFPSSPSSVNASVRDGRYTVPRSLSLSIEEQQRMRQLNQMFPARNFPQSNIPSPETFQGNDRGVRVLPGGNGAAISSGINGSSPMTRPGFHGIASSSLPNSGSMMSSGMVAMPGAANVYTGMPSGQGNSLRPRGAVSMMQASQNQDAQRQVMAPELQMQVSQGTKQGIPPFGVQISSFPNQIASSPLPAYSLHQQPHPISSQQSHAVSPRHPHLQGITHAPTPQHQAYAMPLAKGKPLPQHVFQQKQQPQFATPNSMMPHAPPHPQLPLSSSPQNSSQIAHQNSTAPAETAAAVPQHRQKHQRNIQTAGSGINNQVAKQRPQSQQQEFAQRQQKQRQAQSQQQVKGLKAAGRGNTTMNNAISIESSLRNGASTNPENPSAQKGEHTIRSLQGQGLYSGSPINNVPSGKSSVPHFSNQSHLHQRMYSGQVSSMSKQVQRMPSHSDDVNQGHVASVSSGSVAKGHQSVPPVAMAASDHPQPQIIGHQKLVNQSEPSAQRVLRPSLNGTSDSTMLQGNESQSGQISMVNSTQMGNSSIIPKAPNDVMNVSQLSVPAGRPQNRDSLYNSGTSIRANMASGNFTIHEPSAQVEQGLRSGNPSDNLPPGVHDVSTQWQQHPVQLETPASHVSQQLSREQTPVVGSRHH